MNNLPLISILIPVYNVEPFITRCIKSVMSQTYVGKMECVIVDDCGTDRSMKIIEQLLADYRGNIEFQILRHTHNRGLAATRNTAVEASKGEFIVHLDSDDWIEPTMIELLVNKQRETNADIISCNAIAHKSSGNVILEEPNYSTKEEMMCNIICRTLDHVIWRRIIRASLYKDNGIVAYEGVNIGEDHYTLPRLLFYANSYAKCDETLYHYNCINEHSYMQSCKRMSFNHSRYVNDRDSVNILLDFFMQHDKAIVGNLNKIKAALVYEYIYPMIQTRDKEAYRMLRADWNTIDYKHLKVPALRRVLQMLTFHLKIVRVFIIICAKSIHSSLVISR